jgi:hypothetical protein
MDYLDCLNRVREFNVQSVFPCVIEAQEMLLTFAAAKGSDNFINESFWKDRFQSDLRRPVGSLHFPVLTLFPMEVHALRMRCPKAMTVEIERHEGVPL